MMEQKNFKVLVSDSMAQEGIDILKNYSNIAVDVITKHTEEELIELIGSYHGVIIRSATKMTPDVIKAAKNLKVIVRAGTGYDNINVDECNKRGIVVMITPLGNSNAVVELTIGLMINHARNISTANLTMGEGKWDKKKLKGTELKGKIIGIIGLGRIGAGVAKISMALGMNVIAFDKFIPKKRADDLGVILVDDLDKILTESDYITIHIPLTDQTKNMIDQEQLDKMKPTGVIINTGRGGIINEEALYNTLKEKKIKGACIDVFSSEPAFKDKFRFIGLSNCVTTPHLGASTFEAQINVATLAAEHLAQALNSQIFVDAVNIPFKLSEDLADIYRPYMELGGSLGKFISQYNPNRITEVAIRYKGEILEYFDPIKAVILQSIFSERVTEVKPVTYMNIDKILAEHGINVKVEKYAKPINFETYIKVYIKTEDGEGRKLEKTKIAGTVFSERAKIVEIDGIYYDFAPSNYMILIENTDTPGVIGKIGTLLGTMGINIAGLQLGRKKGGKAVSVITVDEPITKKGLEELKKLPQVLNAKWISL